MARRAQVSIAGLVLALAALWSTEDAFAGDKMRVCVLKISGTRDNDLKNDVVRLINQPYSILKSSTFFKAATRMRIGKKLSPPNLRRLAKFLKLGAMIDGTLVAKSGRYQLVLKVRDGKSGAVVERIRHTLRGKNLNDKEKKRLRRDLISALERIRLDSAEGKSGAGGFGGDDDDDDDDEDVEDSGGDDEKKGDVEEADDLEDEEKDVAPKRKSKAELAAERRAKRAEARRKAKEAREARRQAAADKRRKAREERIARRKAEAERRRKAREDSQRKRREAAEKRRKEREARIAARKAKNSDEEDDLEEDDLEDEEDDLDDEEDEEDLEDEESDSAPTKTASADVAADDDEDEEEEDDVDEDPLLTKGAGQKDAGPTGNPAVVANAGLGAFARTLSFKFDGALMGTERPIDYEGGFVPSAFVDLEIYPLALTGGSGVTANIGIDARFEQALSLSSTVDPDGGSADNAFDVSTTYRRFGVGVRYRLALSKLLVGLRVGYGQSAFELDKANAMGMVDIPNTKYSYIDPGVSVTYPMGKLSIDAAARFLAMLSAGEIQEDTSYGQAKIIALDADAGVNYLVTPKIGVRLGVRLAQMNFSFTGTGMLSDRNGDAAQDVDSAKDQYLGGYLTGSYRF